MKKLIFGASLMMGVLVFSHSANADQSGIVRFKGRLVNVTINGNKNVSCPEDPNRYCDVKVTIYQNGTIVTTVSDGGAVPVKVNSSEYSNNPNTDPKIIAQQVASKLQTDVGVSVAND